MLALVAATAIYAWILPQRYVTPDEGAHLMSARRILFGEFPCVDYSSRQPFYVLVHAIPQIIFGQSLDAGRWVSVVMTLCAGLMAFSMVRGKSNYAAPLAAMFFLLSPLTIHYATVVQTQPVVIVTSGLAILLAIRKRGRWDYLVGLLLATSFYVRESAHAATAAILVVFLFSREWSRVRNVVLGYLGGILVCYLIYATRLSPLAFWDSRLNPAWLVVYSVRKLMWRFADDGSSDIADESEMGEEETTAEGDFLFEPDSYLFLIVATRMLFGPIALFAAGWALGVPARLGEEGRRAAIMISVWLVFLTLFYAYWYLVRGFYPGYLREFELPLAVLGGMVIGHTIEKTGLRFWHAAPLAAFLVVAVQITRLRFPVWIEPLTLAFAGAIGLIVLARGLPRERNAWIRALLAVGTLGVIFLSRRAGGPLDHMAHGPLLSLILLLAAALVLFAGRRSDPGRNGRVLAALAFAGVIVAADSWYQKGGMDFHGRWPRAVVEEVSAAVRERSYPGDEVMSGGMIWAFLADRKPFNNTNHPLGFYDVDVDSPEADRWFQHYKDHPPAIIVLDSFTERIYFKSTALRNAIDRDYRPVFEQGDDPHVTVLLHQSRGLPVSSAPEQASPAAAPNRTASH